MANSNGKLTAYVICPLLVLAIAGLVVMYGDLSVAQDDIAEDDIRDAKQQEILDEIPALTERLKALDKQLEKSDATFDKIADYIKQDSINDAKSHHDH